jgi:hypothetical protein
MKELNILKTIMLALSKIGVIILRNNIGALFNEKGQLVRFGVGGKGGSDLIGINTIIITPEMVGDKIGVFVAIEVKAPSGKLTKEQEQFLNAVRNAGGIAGVARSAEEAVELLNN